MLEQKPQNEQESPVNQERKVSLFGWKIAVLAVVCLIALVYTNMDNDKQTLSPEQLAYQAYVESFDERLLACNEVVNAEPTENFDTCLAAANDGLIDAQKRMVWAYARNGEYQDWQAVFNWLKTIRARDNETQLLLFAILHLMADTDELKQEGELGIKKLVTKNYAPANVLLASIYALEQNYLPKTSSPSWLLKRSFEQKPDLVDPTKLAIIFAKGWVSSPNLSLGTQLLKESAQRDYPLTTNNVAWFLSTLDVNPFTDAKYALDLAKQVIDNPDHAKNPIYVDTLAATYAANNMFDEAMLTQEKAIELLKSSEYSSEFIERELVDYESRLSVYQNKQPLVEESFDKDKELVFRSLRSDIVDYLFRHFRITVEMPQALETTENN